jgi:Mg-chelatase subunit ChlI
VQLKIVFAGQLILEKALTEGESFEPGLQLAANRGILYVDVEALIR